MGNLSMGTPVLVKVIERDVPRVSVRMLPLTTRDTRYLLDEGRRPTAALD